MSSLDTVSAENNTYIAAWVKNTSTELDKDVL